MDFLLKVILRASLTFFALISRCRNYDKYWFVQIEPPLKGFCKKVKIESNFYHDIFFLQTRSDEGKTSLDFSIEASEQKFTLHCPSHYPNYGNDDNFFVEADSGLQMWCNALNEYLLDSDEQLSLSSILNKGLSLYSSADAKSRSRDVSMSSNANEEDEDYDDIGDMDEEDDGQGDDDQLEDILDNDLSWELEIARRRKRWRNKEAQLRDACKKTNSSSGSSSGASNNGSAGGPNNVESSDESSMHQHCYQDPSIKGRQPKQVSGWTLCIRIHLYKTSPRFSNLLPLPLPESSSERVQEVHLHPSI